MRAACCSMTEATTSADQSEDRRAPVCGGRDSDRLIGGVLGGWLDFGIFLHKQKLTNSNSYKHPKWGCPFRFIFGVIRVARNCFYL